MHVITPGETHLAEALYELHADLDDNTSHDIMKGDLDHYAAICAGDPTVADEGGIPDFLTWALDGASMVISCNRASSKPPRNVLTRAAIEAASSSHPKFDDELYFLCAASELKIEHSIRLSLAGDKPHHKVPAAVMFDRDREPFAYLKSVGEHAALAWRGAKLDTDEGVKDIPGGSLFTVKFEDGDRGDVQYAASNAGVGGSLLNLKHIGPPTSVRFIRFSNFLIQNELARLAYEDETRTFDPSVGVKNRYEYLATYIPDVLRLGLEGIGDQVLSLLKYGDTHELRKSELV
jgi:hypothetical protein